MDAKLIETFLDLLDTRNFNRTADRLDLTQSSVSSRIKSLESMIGAQLFERGRSGATPTSAGLRFETHARQLVLTWDQAQREVGGGPDQDRMLRLSGQFSLMRSVLVDWVVELRKRNPRTAIDLQADYSAQIMRDLSLGVVDIGILYAPQYLPDIDVQQVGEENFVMVSTEASTLGEVPNETYINTGYSPYFSQVHNATLPDLASGPLSVGLEEVSLELLSRAGGSTYVPQRFVSRMQAALPWVQIVSDAPQIGHSIFSAVHVRKKHYPEVKTALDILKRTLTDIPR